MRLSGKVAIVTGAADGIGAATAELFAEQGAAVVLGDVDPRGLEMRDRIVTAGGRALFRQTDISREADVAALVAAAEETFGGVDILVNNAAVFVLKGIEATPEDWHRSLDVNVIGTSLCSRYAAEAMKRRGGGAIVNLASINAIRGNNNMVAYAASKGGVLAMTMSLALDHAKDNIRVNCVCPATIDTPMVQAQVNQAPDIAAALAAMQAKHPIGRIAQPEEVASVIAFLASSDASFMTGLAIPIDGGRSIR